MHMHEGFPIEPVFQGHFQGLHMNTDNIIHQHHLLPGLEMLILENSEKAMMKPRKCFKGDIAYMLKNCLSDPVNMDIIVVQRYMSNM